MKADVLLAMVLGSVIGATVVTLYKPAQTAVKNGTNMIKNEASKMLNKEED